MRCVSMMAVLASILLAVCTSLSAQATGAGVGADEGTIISFPTTPEVSLKMKTGRYVRGKLLALSKFEAVVETGSGARESTDERGTRIGSDKFETLRTSNGKLVYTPAEADFTPIVALVRANFATATFSNDPDSVAGGLPGAEMPASLPGAAALPGAEPTKPVESSKPKVTPNLGNGGFGGLGNVPKKSNTPVAGETPAGTDSPAMKTEAPVSGTEVAYCSNCNKEVSVADQAQGTCPHCKTVWSLPAPAPAPLLPGADGTSPLPSAAHAAPAFPGGAQFPGGAVAPQPGPGVAAVPAPPGPGGATISPAGITLDSIPGWAKACVFVALLLVAYHIFFR